MKRVDLRLVDAFTDTPLMGNAASVVLHAEGIPEESLHRISREIGVSETAFVSPPETDGCDHKIRFFTPTQEVDLCGHATIAAYFALAEEGAIPLTEGRNRFVQETRVGSLPVWVESSGGKPVKVTMSQKLPRFETPEINLDKIAALFGLGRKQIKENLPVEIVSTGVRSLHIPVAGLSGFADLKVLRRGLFELSHTLDIVSIQLFTMETSSEQTQVHCRVFAPMVGIEEDPVTGTAAGALGAYIVRHGLLPESKEGLTSLTVEQGAEIDREGRVDVEIEREDEEWKSIRVGGTAVVTLKSKLKIAK